MAFLRVLVVNAGSTSLKLSLVGEDEVSTSVESLADAPADVPLVGHRVVHGGAGFVEPVVIDDGVASDLEALSELAPLHNGSALAAVAEARDALPDAVHVAVFDTAFHATMPEVATTYAIPRAWRDLGLRRFGFHGISVRWAAERVQAERLVVCHLGGGCSVSAVLAGRSVDTTMGLTPLEGVPMATRSGSVDPGLLLYLLRHGLATDELEQALEHDSGLAGLSGTSSRVDELEAAAAGGDAGAGRALDVYVRRIAQAVAGMAVSLGGVDAVAFTGGVGEGSAFVRERVCGDLGFLGVELDSRANAAAEDGDDVAAGASAVRVVVVRAREEIVIAREARRAVMLVG